MPYRHPRKLFWSYAFHVPNIGTKGKIYETRYEFKLESPTLSDFELEMTHDDYKVRPSITLWITQGRNKVVSKIPLDDFEESPLSTMISKQSWFACQEAMVDVERIITDMRKKFQLDYSTYYNNSTVYKEGE